MAYRSLVHAVTLLALCQAAVTVAQPVKPSVTNITAMEPAIEAAYAAADRDGPERVLVVFDIDSTLLFDPLGGPDLADMKDSEPERFRPVERALMYLKSLAPTEPDLAQQLGRLDARGIATYALSARGEDMRDMTMRELARADIAFPLAPECGPPLCINRGTLAPDTVLAAARAVLGDAELARLGFDRGRPVGVSEGVMNAAGLHKGVMLRLLLASLGRDYHTVIFVDDAQKNVDHVADAAAAMPQQVMVFHYRMNRPQPPVAQDLRNQRWKTAQDAICLALAPDWCKAGDQAGAGASEAR
jgi:hypothetical protein